MNATHTCTNVLLRLLYTVWNDIIYGTCSYSSRLLLVAVNVECLMLTSEFIILEWMHEWIKKCYRQMADLLSLEVLNL